MSRRRKLANINETITGRESKGDERSTSHIEREETDRGRKVIRKEMKKI